MTLTQDEPEHTERTTRASQRDEVPDHAHGQPDPPGHAGQGAGAGRGAATRADYERELAAAVTDVVARQADTGLDVVNDGEFGKSGWSGYALARVTGFEVRKDQLKPLDWLGRDRERFKGFFTDNPELPRRADRRPRAGVRRADHVHRHELVKRDLANLRAAAAAYPGREAVLHQRRAGQHGVLGRERVLQDRRRVRLRDRRGDAPGVPRHPRGGVHPPGRRRRARQHVRPPQPARGRASTSAGRGCGSRRSTTRSPGSRKTGSAITSASAAGMSRTSLTRRSRRSST